VIENGRMLENEFGGRLMGLIFMLLFGNLEIYKRLLGIRITS
jgi:hypothetical protein